MRKHKRLGQKKKCKLSTLIFLFMVSVWAKATHSSCWSSKDMLPITMSLPMKSLASPIKLSAKQVRTLTQRQGSPPLAPVTLTSFSLRSFPPKKGSSHPLNMASVAASHKDQGSMTCRHELTSTQRANALKSTTMVHSKTKHKVATPFLSLSLSLGPRQH